MALKNITENKNMFLKPVLTSFFISVK